MSSDRSFTMTKTATRSLLMVWPYYDPDPGAAAVRGRAFFRYMSQNRPVTAIIQHHRKNVGYSKEKDVFRLNLRSSMWSIWFDYRLMRRATRNIHVDDVLVSVPSVYMALSGALLALRRGATLYVDIRDIPIKRGVVGWIQWLIVRFLCTRARAIFVTTEMQSIQLQKRIGILNALVVQNGVDEVRFSKKTYDVCMLGSVGLERNIPALSLIIEELVRLMPNISIRWIGYDSHHADEINFKNRFKDRIQCVEEMPNDLAIEGMASARVGLVTLADLSSLDGQLPTKVYEYCSRGVVVAGYVPSRNATLRRFIEDSGVGIVSDDPYRLALDIVNLLSDHSRLRLLSENAMRVARGFLRENILKRLDIFFHE